MTTEDPGMGCDEVEAMLPLVADGVLDAEGDPALFAHLARCPACQDSLARHDLVSLALARGPHAPPPRLQRILLPLPQAFGAAAAVACAGMLAWNMLGTSGPSAHAMTILERTALEPSEEPTQAIDGIPSEASAETAAKVAATEADATNGDANADADAESNASAAANADADAQQPPFIVLQDGRSFVLPAEPLSESRPPLTHPALNRY